MTVWSARKVGGGSGRERGHLLRRHAIHFAKVLFVAFAAALAAGAPAFGASNSLRPDQVAAIKDAAQQALTASHVPSLVIEVDRDGNRVYARAWGKRSVADNLPANIETLYQYGSITKQFTAMCIFLLAQDGKLSLDDPVGKYLPEFSKTKATLRQLLVHTSGIADFTDTKEYLGIAQQIQVGTKWGLQWSASHPPAFPPGQKAEYDNAGYLILARVVEHASGKSFDSFLQTRIFDVAHMPATYEYRYMRVQPNEAAGYLWWGRDVLDFAPNGAEQGAKPNQLVNMVQWNLRQVDGAGYLVGDAADLQSWDNALLAGKFLHGKWRDLYFSSGVLGDGSPTYAGPENKAVGRPTYCYGGLAKFVINGHTVYGANGSTFGFLTFTATLPDKHISVTVLSNVKNWHNTTVTEPLLRALLK